MCRQKIGGNTNGAAPSIINFVVIILCLSLSVVLLSCHGLSSSVVSLSHHLTASSWSHHCPVVVSLLPEPPQFRLATLQNEVCLTQHAAHDTLVTTGCHYGWQWASAMAAGDARSAGSPAALSFGGPVCLARVPLPPMKANAVPSSPRMATLYLRKSISISTTQDAVLSRPVGLPMGSLTRGFLMWGNM
jgi:hypothetical protein